MRFVTDHPRNADRDAAPPDAGRLDGGERRLARPPSERYGAAAGPEPPAPTAESSDGASPFRGVAFGAVAAILGAAVIVVLGGAMAISAGLLVAAAAVGYAVGLATVAGAGATMSRVRRAGIAASLAVLGVALGQVGLWLFARTEGGVLSLIDYLGQTFGPLVPLELLLAGGVAWWRSR